MQTSVDNYLLEGCLRCPLGGTPDCKVLQWTEELKLLRSIALDCGLTEEVKWGVPCYTFRGANVLLLSALKGHCAVSFLKGVLLSNEKGLLEKPGPNSQSDRFIPFTNTQQISALEDDIKACIYEAIEVEKAGLKVHFKKSPEPIPEELEKKFEEDPTLKAAFEALTPGRQRGYVLYFSAPKKTETRLARIEKSVGKILNGEGMHDKYKGRG